MGISSAIAPLWTTSLAESIDFYTAKVGLTLEFRPDPSIAYVDRGDHFHLYLETDDIVATADRLERNGVSLVRDVHETPWGTRELVIKDDQGHTLYVGQHG